ncbi:MAG: c-type cytochrome [Paracoccaceae bacterium]
MDTMTWTKIIGASCGSLLILLLIQWVAEEVYHNSHNKYTEVAYLLEIDEEVTEVKKEEATIPFIDLVTSADLSKGKKVFGKCKACHKLGDGENGTGPHLFNIIGREMAVVSDFKYSSSFKGLEGNWTVDELNLFLTKPSNYIKGTAMNFAGLGKATDRANLIAYLENSTK